MEIINEVKIIEEKFNKWNGVPVKDDYNGKAIVDYNGTPLYAEIAVLNKYKDLGFNGVWVDNFRKKFRIDLPEKHEGVELPKVIKIKLDTLIESNGSISGCWDLLLWKNDELKFIELKRSKKDAIRDTQIKWLENAIKQGMSINSFSILEWDLI